MDERHFKMWVKSSCPYCQDAQLLLLQNALIHEVEVVDDNPTLLSEVQDRYEWRTVPVIVEYKGAEERLIGGYTDLVEHLKLPAIDAGG
tara:strand:+ start:20497 stop:20763 length:267 start_codon:yes stop_codon:yes gene_type:complete